MAGAIKHYGLFRLHNALMKMITENIVYMLVILILIDAYEIVASLFLALVF